jgi:xanthine/CO dehydrogenase XdhC/CoxF family maturation factor
MSSTSPSDPLSAAAAWRGEGLAVALATVVKTWGSAPRQPGAQMCINERGDFVGSVSGGCVEGAVIQEAQELLAASGDDLPAAERIKLLAFGVTDADAWEVGLACGGQVEVFVERVE